MNRIEYLELIAKTQNQVEKLLSTIRMDARQGIEMFEQRANELAESLFTLHEYKDLKLVTLRSKANDLIKQAAQLHADYFEYDQNPKKFMKEYQERINKVENRGGKREGAGRKSIGVKKPVSITLPQEDWDEIDNLIKAGEFKSYAEYFRSLREGIKRDT